MLHLTNGDSAAAVIRQAGLAGDVVAWRDVLHEGPVPAGLAPDALRPVRSAFLAALLGVPEEEVRRDFEARDAALAASAVHDEVVLWFEHDLYDQLQLLQVLDRFAGEAARTRPLRLVCRDEYLGPMAPERAEALFEAREDVSDAVMDLARRAWAAFRAPDPSALSALLGGDLSPLPYLRAALLRHLEEFPSERDGLSRSERQALEAVADGRSVVREVYPAAHHAREAAIFLGDSVFATYLERLSPPDAPLLRFDDGRPVTAPRSSGEEEAFWARRVVLTARGRAVLAGREDFAAAGLDRWLGGVHLYGRAAWRWDGERVRAAGAGPPEGSGRDSEDAF